MEKLHNDFECEIIIDNFELPLFRYLGNYDSSSSLSILRSINSINLMINQDSEKLGYLHICDRSYISSKFGHQQWKDYGLWLSAKYSVSYHGISYLSYLISKIIESIMGNSKKCLVLDLDNTLWGGVIGDDGIDGIILGKESSIGEAYLDFHSYIKKLKNRGIILAVCSKNDLEIAKSGFDHPDSILKVDDFVAFKANWENKAKNIYDISQEINLGLESIVFFDDYTVERDLVRKELDGIVSVPEIGNDVTRYREIIDASELFNITSISNEDKLRNDFYLNDRKEVALNQFNNYDDYLKSLNMTSEIQSFNQTYSNRITQLINKTNQFNLTTKRTTKAEIDSLINNNSVISLYAKLNDKFGENGLVSVICGAIDKDQVVIDLWLMSCRVFKRTLENSVINEFLKLQNLKIKYCNCKYIPTPKNKIVSNLYEDIGFSLKSETETLKIFELDLKNLK